MRRTRLRRQIAEYRRMRAAMTLSLLIHALAWGALWWATG